METAHDFRTRHLGPDNICGNCGKIQRYPIQCGDRFCEPCRKNRKGKLINRLEPVVESMVEPHFLTLTIRRTKITKKNVQNLRHSFLKLRHRDVWLNAFGGFYNIELGTVNPDGTANLHIHVLYDGMDIYQPYLSWCWSQVADGYVVYIQRCESSRASMFYLTKHFCKIGYCPDNIKSNINDVLKKMKLVQGFGIKRLMKTPKQPRKPIICPNCKAEDSFVSCYDPLFNDVLSAFDGSEYDHHPAKAMS